MLPPKIIIPLIYECIKENKGRKMDPWGIPEVAKIVLGLVT